MPDEGSWLVFKVSEKDPQNARKKAHFISVPKKVVPLSTRRNRIRRLIREAVRQDPFFSAAGTFYEFKVTVAPLDPKLTDVKAALQKIKSGTGQ